MERVGRRRRPDGESEEEAEGKRWRKEGKGRGRRRDGESGEEKGMKERNKRMRLEKGRKKRKR